MELAVASLRVPFLARWLSVHPSSPPHRHTPPAVPWPYKYRGGQEKVRAVAVPEVAYVPSEDSSVFHPEPHLWSACCSAPLHVLQAFIGMGGGGAHEEPQWSKGEHLQLLRSRLLAQTASVRLFYLLHSGSPPHTQHTEMQSLRTTERHLVVLNDLIWLVLMIVWWSFDDCLLRSPPRPSWPRFDWFIPTPLWKQIIHFATAVHLI